MTRTPIRRTGFALPWIILTVAIFAVLAATVAPTLATMNDRARAASAAAQLKAIALGVIAFRTAVGNYPGNVSELTNALTTSNRNSCRVVMTPGNVSSWPASAPYVVFYTGTGANAAWTAIGGVRDSVPVRSSTAAVSVEIPGVTGEIAALFSSIVDGASGDTVTYASPVNDTTTITYRVVSTGQLGPSKC